MVTMQISVSETAAKLIERTVREKQFAGPSEYIEGLIEADHAEHLDIDPEHRKWMNEQIQQALDSDPADDIRVTPQFWEDWRKELEEKVAKGVAK